MFRALYISRSLQTMGQLINAGVPMLDTLAITGDISGNRLYKGMWKRVHTSVKQGKKVTAAAEADHAAAQERRADDRRGRGVGQARRGARRDLGLLPQAAPRRRSRASPSMIEPLMIIIMGSIVGFIAMAIILPIFKMSQIVK
jgi:type IV pilus assembly protein PilC